MMDGKWTTNLLLLPPITAALIDKWADEKHRIPKLVQTKGYSNWIEGYVHDVEGKLITVLR